MSASQTDGVFLLRPRFWLLAGLLMLAATAVTFGFVSLYHHQSQDPDRSPAEQQDVGNKSETLGYLGSAFAGLFFVMLFIAGVCWVVGLVIGLGS